ncbi:hypothetical protein WJX81_002785 [Elliptochloris bilobata]|uniref:Transmembrane protein 19 n=1 Tax=Elliptochloris bilobata TaxID=381761 RepID=A0AAW1RDZ1_9CHLO
MSRSGAAAALVVGSVHMACGVEYGLTLILFYLTGSRLTRIGSKAKAALEERYEESSRRTATQVLANSLAGSVLAVTAAAAAAGALPVQAPAAWRAALHGAFLGHYACCCADTWSSELGMLSAGLPRLITNPRRRVPRGTNGGVSLLGLKAGAAGGALMGAAFWLAGGDLGLALGTLGTLLDSLLGATLQYSGVHTASGRMASAPGPGMARVCGRLVLSNDGVNALAAASTALAGGAAGLLLQGM